MNEETKKKLKILLILFLISIVLSIYFVTNILAPYVLNETQKEKTSNDICKYVKENNITKADFYYLNDHYNTFDVILYCNKQNDARNRT